MIKLFDENMNEIEFDADEYQTELYPLENFAPYGLIIDNLYFPTAEHAFQYFKFIGTNEEISEKIRLALSPNEAREIARENKKKRISNWKEYKYDVMDEVIGIKVNQNPIVKEVLLNTRDLLIAEYCIDEDTDWGIDKNNKGNNHLGKSLMKVRENIRNK